jgi:hypothetical protein
MGTSPDIDDLMPAELKKLLVKPLARNAEQQQPIMKLLEENAEQKRVVAACCPPGGRSQGHGRASGYTNPIPRLCPTCCGTAKNTAFYHERA